MKISKTSPRSFSSTDIAHTGFKLTERCEAIEDTLSDPVIGFVVQRAHGLGEVCSCRGMIKFVMTASLTEILSPHLLIATFWVGSL